MSFLHIDAIGICLIIISMILVAIVVLASRGKREQRARQTVIYRALILIAGLVLGFAAHRAIANSTPVASVNTADLSNKLRSCLQQSGATVTIWGIIPQDNGRLLALIPDPSGTLTWRNYVMSPDGCYVEQKVTVTTP